MKKQAACLLLTLFSYCIPTLGCSLTLYVEKTATQSMVFNVVSTDGKIQSTTGLLAPGKYNSVYLTCGVSYNIYAQGVSPQMDHQTGPYGDYAYNWNPLLLTGDLGLFFPSQFTPISGRAAKTG